MKTAKKIPIGFELDCPVCGGTVPNPEGITNWTRQELEANAGGVTACEDCGATCKVPKK